MSEIFNMVNICKSYNIGDDELEVLHEVNLTVHSGEFLSILLIRCLYMLSTFPISWA